MCVCCVCVCGSRYVEDDPLSKKLYITNIRESDEGTYRCRGTRGDFSAHKDVTLKLYSNCPPHCFTSRSHRTN